MAMLKALAPKARMPPSPKNSAWIASAIDMARIAADGPSTIAATAMPTACAVVPPGIGRLNIMMTKLKAEVTASSGTTRLCSTRFTRLTATYQKGAAAT